MALSLARSRTGYKGTDNVINRLIRGAIQTGLFASLFALGDLFCFLWLRDTNLYAMFAYPLGRIYTNVRKFPDSRCLHVSSFIDSPSHTEFSRGVEDYECKCSRVFQAKGLIAGL